MPVFEFRCSDCGKRFQDLIRQNEHARCPECGSTNLTKLVSRFRRGRDEDERLGEMLNYLETHDDANLEKSVKEIGNALEEGVGEDFAELFSQDQTDP